MDIIRMTGGLGNQMFQYALYLKLASLGREVKFDDISEYSMENARPIMLWAFGIDYPRASREEINRLTDGFTGISHRIRRKLTGRKSLEYHERDSNFDEQVLARTPAYLTGYFQSEKYFAGLRNRVLAAFTFRSVIYCGLSGELEEKVQILLYTIENTVAVSLHIRRGDYLENSEVFGGSCTQEYYKKAVQLVKERYPDAAFFVFNNDEEWTLRWLSESFPDQVVMLENLEASNGRGVRDTLSGKFIPMTGIPEDLGYLDMMLMSKCRHHIIANSSFSWWGAYLNPSKDKTVIAPAKWFGDRDCRDIYTKEMIRVTHEGELAGQETGGKEKERKTEGIGKCVSVIVTAYNIEAYLPRCMESLLGQTCPNMEIILVDDGSADRTPEICDRYEREQERVRVIHKENGGPSSARNAGIDVAKGDFIGYVDGDDWVEPEMYERMLEACLESGADVAICTYRQVGRGAEAVYPTGRVLELGREETLELYISGHPQYHIYHSVWSKLFRRELLSDIRFPEGRKSEDIMYTTKALVKASRCVFLDTPYYNYMMDRETSIMNSKFHERRFGDEIPFWKEQAAYLEKNGYQELARKADHQFYRKMLFYYEDFRDRGMEDSAAELSDLLYEEKEKIRKIYGESFVPTGDRARMKLFLASPGCFYRAVKLYERVVIPLRQ